MVDRVDVRDRDGNWGDGHPDVGGSDGRQSRPWPEESDRRDPRVRVERFLLFLPVLPLWVVLLLPLFSLIVPRPCPSNPPPCLPSVSVPLFPYKSCSVSPRALTDLRVS